MHRPLVSILLLWSFAIHTLFGGFGGAAICFGAEHDHGHCEVAEAHRDDGCAHADEPSWPTPTPADHHDDDCTCADVELASFDLVSQQRDEIEGGAAPDFVVPVAWLIDDRAPVLTWRGPPPRVVDDPGVRARLVVVRTMRLLI